MAFSLREEEFFSGPQSDKILQDIHKRQGDDVQVIEPQGNEHDKDDDNENFQKNPDEGGVF
jgi:hypothetical protein